MVAVGTEQSACPRDVVGFPGFSSLLESESQPGLVVQRGRLPPPVTLAQGGSAVEPGPCTAPRTMTNTDRQARQGRRSGEPFAGLPLESPATPERGLNGLDWKPPTNIPHDAANPDVSHEPPVPADGKIHTGEIKRPWDFRWE